MGASCRGADHLRPGRLCLHPHQGAGAVARRLDAGNPAAARRRRPFRHSLAAARRRLPAARHPDRGGGQLADRRQHGPVAAEPGVPGADRDGHRRQRHGVLPPGPGMGRRHRLLCRGAGRAVAGAGGGEPVGRGHAARRRRPVVPPRLPGGRPAIADHRPWTGGRHRRIRPWSR